MEAFLILYCYKFYGIDIICWVCSSYIFYSVYCVIKLVVVVHFISVMFIKIEVPTNNLGRWTVDILFIIMFLEYVCFLLDVVFVNRAVFCAWQLIYLMYIYVYVHLETQVSFRVTQAGIVFQRLLTVVCENYAHILNKSIHFGAFYYTCI